jgi:hypothetical protein
LGQGGSPPPSKMLAALMDIPPPAPPLINDTDGLSTLAEYGAHLGPHGCMGVTICVLCLGPVGQVRLRRLFYDPRHKHWTDGP